MVHLLLYTSGLKFFQINWMSLFSSSSGVMINFSTPFSTYVLKNSSKIMAVTPFFWYSGRIPIKKNTDALEFFLAWSRCMKPVGNSFPFAFWSASANDGMVMENVTSLSSLSTMNLMYSGLTKLMNFFFRKYSFLFFSH